VAADDVHVPDDHVKLANAAFLDIEPSDRSDHVSSDV